MVTSGRFSINAYSVPDDISEPLPMLGRGE